MRISSLFVILSCFAALSACRGDGGPHHEFDGTHLNSTDQAIETTNRVVLNRVVLNRVVLNRVVLNSLSDENLSHGSLSQLKKTEEGRELLVYLVRCALAEDDILTVTHKDDTYAFAGLMGLASEWTSRGLTNGEQHWISACMLGHVNAYGVSVEVSMRSRELIAASPEEEDAFPVYEATFFGQIFNASGGGDDDGEEEEAENDEDEDAATSGDIGILAYACLGSDPDIANAHASTRSLRVCADSTPDCEIEALGYCRDVCETHIDGIGWTDCWADGVRYAETTSTFLRKDEGLCQQSCDGEESCILSCASAVSDPAFIGGQILDCGASDGLCITHCSEGTCSVDANHSNITLATIRDAAQAEIGCADAELCVVDCKGDDTSCELDCTDADLCFIEDCEDGAECLADCSDADHCGIDDCDGELTECGNGVVVCNRDCP